MCVWVQTCIKAGPNKATADIANASCLLNTQLISFPNAFGKLRREVIAPISPRGMSNELDLQSTSPQSRPLKFKANYLQFKKSWDCLLNTYRSLQACSSCWCLPPLTHWLRKWGHETRIWIVSPGHSHSAFSNTPRWQPFNKFLNVLDTKQSLCGGTVNWYGLSTPWICV